MTSDVVNRSTVRGQIAGLLNPLVAAKTVQAVYSYQVGDFAGQSPVLVVMSGPAQRTKITEEGLMETLFRFYIHSFVLYATEDATWTEAQSETRIDLIEKSVTDILIDNFDTYWIELSMIDFSEIDAVTVGSMLYRHETITVEVQIYGK